MAVGKERILDYLHGLGPAAPRPPDAAAFAAGLHTAKTRAFEAIVAAGGIGLRPGVARLVAEARAAGLRLAIATTATQSAVEVVLARAGGGACPASSFDVVGAGDVVAAKKPAPDIYLWVLGRLGCAPAQCLTIEDSAAGLAAARAAGLATLVTASALTAGHDFSGAAALLSDLGEAGAACRVLAGPPCESGGGDLAWLCRLHAPAAL